jgi:two-component system, sensor histidine kinase
MKRSAFILYLTLTFGVSILFGNSTVPTPKNGVLDLRESLLDNQTILNLNGEWIFHWEELLDPTTFKQDETEGITVTVPSYWTSYEVDGQSLPGEGYGTYNLKVLLPEDFHTAICFDIPVFDVAYKFYLNDRLVSSNGVVGTSREEEQPWYEPKNFCYIEDADTLELLIQVSNFHHRRGGFWKPVVVGQPDKVLKRLERQRIFNYSTIGVLFFFMLFFLIFQFFSRREIIMLIFALTILGILIRSVNTGLYFSNFFIDTSWSWQIRMEYLGSYLAQLFGVILLHKLFPHRYMNRIITINTSVMALASLSLFILPVRLFTWEMLVYQPLLVLFLLHYGVVSLIGTFKGRFMDAIFFVSLSFLLYTLINDILLANTAGSAYGNYLSQISFQLFIFAMAVLIIRQWANNYKERLKLESSLRFKNRVLSVIAHDLKNPIASVAQFSDLLRSKPELATKEHIVNSLGESSQAAVTLLDNLLFWGRNESDSLSVAPVSLDMNKMVKEVGALYHHMALQKEIVYTSDVERGIKAFADPVHIRIVLRNLVANALKFTRKDGSVQIKAWQEENRIHCSIVDTGVGMKSEYLKQFKKEGYLSSSEGTDQEIGTGLGLQLVTDLLEKNKGTLEIESKTNVGSTFTFTLPVDNKG